jgi:protein-tyrosine phosphatase
MNKQYTYASLVTLILLFSLLGCSRGPESLSANERPIPSQLPSNERESLRKLPFKGAHNFRDLGGYKTTDGRQIKWGLLYRSDKLSELTSTDEQYMERLSLKRIVDFRSVAEREAQPDRIAPDSSIRIEQLPVNVSGVNPDLIKNKIESGDVSQQEMSKLLIDANREFVEKYTPLYREWIQSLLDKDAVPMVFHCTAGKDRTGFAAALVLLALGVPKDTVMSDYLATNTFTGEHVEKTLLVIKLASFFQTDVEAIRPLFGVEAEFLQEAFNAIDEHYGSTENYLQNGLGLDKEKLSQLKNLLTEAI